MRYLNFYLNESELLDNQLSLIKSSENSKELKLMRKEKRIKLLLKLILLIDTLFLVDKRLLAL